jgi:hypothetical protein
MKGLLSEVGKCEFEKKEANHEKSLLVFSKSWFDHGMEILCISLIGFVLCGYSNLSHFLSNPYVFFVTIIFGIIGALLLILLVIIMHRSHPFLDRSKTLQYPDNLDTSGLDYDAIIIAHSSGFHDIGMGTGVHNIVNKLSQEKYPYKIIHCDDPECVADALRDNHAKYIWIFSHGWRGGLDLKKGDLIYEKFVRENPGILKKKFIGQFHCNPLSKKRPNTSLIETLIDKPNPNQYFITEDSMNHYSVWDATRKLAKNIRRNPIFDEKPD